MPKRPLIYAGVFLAGLFLFYLTVLVVMPAEIIERAVAGSLKGGAGVRIESAPFQRAFPFGVSSPGFTVTTARGARQLVLDELVVRFSPLSPFTGTLRANLDGTAGGGTVVGRVEAGKGSVSLDLKVERLPLSALGGLKGLGVDVAGAVSGSAAIRGGYTGCPEGVVRAKGEGMKARGIRVFGFALPFGEITASGLELELDGQHGGACLARIKGVWLEGERLGARLSGTVRLKTPVEASGLDLLLEVTPRGGAVEDFERLVFLAPFRKTPGYYAIRVRGTIGAPRI